MSTSPRGTSFTSRSCHVKIVSLRAWELGVGSDESNFDRDTFYAWLIPAEVAQAEIARDRAGI
jgi:hypothetical protein